MLGKTGPGRIALREFDEAANFDEQPAHVVEVACLEIAAVRPENAVARIQHCRGPAAPRKAYAPSPIPGQASRFTAPSQRLASLSLAAHPFRSSFGNRSGRKGCNIRSSTNAPLACAEAPRLPKIAISASPTIVMIRS